MLWLAVWTSIDDLDYHSVWVPSGAQVAPPRPARSVFLSVIHRRSH